MEKAITYALAILIFMSSAAAGPIQMNDKELDLIHAGNDGSSLQFSSILNSDGSGVFIKDGVEHEIRIGSSLSLPDGTKVEIKPLLEQPPVPGADLPAAALDTAGNGYTTLVTKGDITGSTWLSVSNSIAKASLKLEGVSVCTGSGCK